MATRKRSTGKLPLEIRLKAGTHASLVYNDPAQLDAALGFLAEGLRAGEPCVVLAYARFNERVTAQLRDLHGIDIRKCMVDGNVAFMNGHEDAGQIRDELEEYFSRAHRARKPSRLVTNLGWGEADWPEDGELMLLESSLNALCVEHEVAGLCLYNERQLSGAVMVHGAFECHPVVIVRSRSQKNPFYVDPAQFSTGLPAARREGGRLQAWIG